MTEPALELLPPEVEQLQDVLEALRYAAWRAQEREIDLTAAE